MNDQEKEQFAAILNELSHLRLNKNEDYGNSWKIFGLMGIVYPIGGKFIRIWNLLKGKEPKNESLRDSFKDIAIYCTMAMQLLDNEETEPLL